MAICFISGKPGGGKSYYATVCILDRLRHSKKQIVTNVPLNVGEICHQLHEQYGETFGAAERIRLLDETETSQFWVYFGNGLELDTKNRLSIRMADGRVVPHLDYSPRYRFALASVGSGGVCYFIDEAHEFFNAREWKDLGKDCLHYLSQHRKLGDEVVFITQHVRNVDTQLRRLAAEFCYCRNHLKEKFPGLGGLVRSYQRLGVSFYNQEESATAVQVDHKFISPQWETIGKCYDTAAGVGIGGNAADKGERAKGLPFYFIFVAIFLVCGAVWWVTSPRAIGAVTGGMGVPRSLTTGVGESRKSSAPAAPGLVGGSAVQPMRTNVVQATNAVVESREPEPPQLVGVRYDPRQGCQAYFSDGTEIDAKDCKRWKFLRRGQRVVGVEIDGVEHRLTMQRPEVKETKK